METPEPIAKNFGTVDLPLSLPLFITIVNLQEVADPNPNPPL